MMRTHNIPESPREVGNEDLSLINISYQVFYYVMTIKLKISTGVPPGRELTPLCIERT